MIPFRAIGVFFEVASHQSVSAAAKKLGVTPSAVTQQLRVLEERLGKALVVRAGRRIRLTEAGEHYFEMISGNMERIVVATDRVRGSQAPAVLTVRASPSVATKWLLPHLPRFLEANPDLDVHLDGSNEPTDFARESIDVGIYHGTGRWPGLHVLPLIDEPFVPVCSPELAAAGSLTPRDIPAFRMIHSVKAQLQWRDWFGRVGAPELEARRRLMFDRSHMTVDAAAAGLGIALDSMLMMERELRDGLLVVPIPRVPLVQICTQWIVCPHQNARRRHVRRFIDWAKVEAEAWRRSIDFATTFQII